MPRNPLLLAVCFFRLHPLLCPKWPAERVRNKVTRCDRCDKLIVCREELVPEGSYRLTTARKDPLVCGIKIQCNGFPFGHATS